MAEQGPFLVEIRLDTAEGGAKQAYDAVYQETDFAQIESFYLWLMEQLHLPPHGRLLDVSCGSGAVVRLAAQRGLQATGIDISEVAARTAQRHAGPFGATIGVSNGERLPFPDQSFDFVTNIGSLEHFVDPAQGVREMVRILRPGGQAYVLLPNTFSLLTNIWNAFRTGRTSADPFQPIQRYGARTDWALLLQSNGLVVRRTLKYERPRPRTLADWGYYFRRPKEMLRLIATPFVPLNLAWCFLFMCERAI